ncbi:ABC transporter permease subunit [uncultured Kiloniella sp.]|uniref:ABC transporter permease subunit n=1 Tax=uncultured Kiloniella sp. TaxID=1133091 RepID=UPI002617AC53|nr:ABC transporter permease subunit [uncultured Kiloniella sp.]
MLRFILTKLGVLIPTFLGVTLIAFSFIRMLPGDPIELLAGERGVTPERHAQLMADLGFDRPIWEQYFSFLWGILQGDFGVSFTSRTPVLEEFLTRFPATVELAGCAIIFAALIGLPAGIIAAVKRGSAFDHTLMGISLAGYSMPIFWWGLLLIILFSSPDMLGLTPVSGRLSALFWIDQDTGFMLIDAFVSDEKGAFKSAVSHLILPTIVLGTIPMAIIARQTRSAMLEVLGEDYVRTAKAKGLSAMRIVGVHALRNALITVVTVIGLQVGVLLAGAILTETIFSWPGIGKWMIDSISRRDYFAVQGGIVLIASIVMMVNLLVDFMYGLINPRILHRR